jgi:predicted nucleic acid-binding protein
VDAAIFIYHFTGVSPECRSFLERCETGEVNAITNTVVLAETAHRLMMIEAVAQGLVTPGDIVKKLRKRPALIRRLQEYQAQIERIPLMSVEVVPVDLGTVFRSANYRSEHGLLFNDSLVVASALDHGIDTLASPDTDFGRVKELKTYTPGDLS